MYRAVVVGIQYAFVGLVLFVLVVLMVILLFGLRVPALP
jgi:hypothetical protein